MSQEWYLTTPPTYTSGFEKDDFYEYQSPTFQDLLTTEIGENIQTFDGVNFDKRKETQVIFQSVSSGEKENDEYRMLSDYGDIHTGQYFYYLNKYWIVKSNIMDNHICEISIVHNCEHNLKFQYDGHIYSYPYFVKNNTMSFDNTKYTTTSSSERTIKLRYDDISKNLCIDMRFFGNTFGDGVPQVWKVVDIGIENCLLVLKVEKDQYNINTDNIEEGICGYTQPAKTNDYAIRCSRSIKNNEILIGRSYPFYIETEEKYEMYVDDDTVLKRDNNYWILQITDKKRIGDSLLLLAKIGDTVVNQKLTIAELY